MRILILLRGIPGIGKSYFIERNGLGPYTLSSDSIRLLHASPVLDESGNMVIPQNFNNSVFRLLFQLLEDRMKRGELVCVDATHINIKDILQYKKLLETYRYRIYTVEFEKDNPKMLETAKLQNANRERPYRVPDMVIDRMYKKLKESPLPNWCNSISPPELNEKLIWKPVNLDKYDKVVHIGDIHGCFEPVKEYFDKNPIVDTNYYIFVGDYVDRGCENKEVLEFLLGIYEKENVCLLEGNHELHLWDYATGKELKSAEFRDNTIPQIESLDKKDLRQLCRKMRQVLCYEFNNKFVQVTHGGLSTMVGSRMAYISMRQIIHGVGDYECPIDDIFKVYSDEFTKNHDEHFSVWQVHGHRNKLGVSLESGKETHSFNLEGRVEFGGQLRIVEFGKEEITCVEITNNLVREDNKVVEFKDSKLQALKDSKWIKVQTFGDISSFNFTRDAFSEKHWNDLTITARGLFVNNKTEECVIRGFNKFFNVLENKYVEFDRLRATWKFPVTVYLKENGFLGLVGYDSSTDSLVIASKSSLTGPHAEYLNTFFMDNYSDKVDWVKEYLKKNNSTLVFEVIAPDFDPHIIKYNKSKLVLLDIIERDIDKFDKRNYKEVERVAWMLGLEYKAQMKIIDNFDDFLSWYVTVNTMDNLPIEGYVLEDSVGFMVKMKLPYYNFWKKMRSLQEIVYKCKCYNKEFPRDLGHFLSTEKGVKFFEFLKEQDLETLEKDIISLREEFLKTQD